MIRTHCAVRAAKCMFTVLLYLLSATYSGRDDIRLQDKVQFRAHTTRSKVKLEHDLHSIYTVQSALQHSRIPNKFETPDCLKVT